MEEHNVIIIKNRSIEHYLLIIFSLILKGEKEIILRSIGSVSGKTIDVANFITKELAPDMFDMNIENGTGMAGKYKVSIINVHLKVRSDGEGEQYLCH
jgi:DNA-binding protein